MKLIAQKILLAQTILLTTHREGDGDGLGAQTALYHGLKKLKKDVRILNVDPVPARFQFLNESNIIQNFENVHDQIAQTDLALIFDTNDQRLVEPLYSALKQKCKEILFVDHHPILLKGPPPSAGSHIDTTAASTGEIAYGLIKELGISLDRNIATSLYTSIVFDTQLFRYIRGSEISHLICADLLKYDVSPELIHRKLFGNQTIQKISFIAGALGRIEYFYDGQVAFLKISDQELKSHNLPIDASRDLIDMIMNVNSLQIAVLFREDKPNSFKLSFRSKGELEVLNVAEAIGGGGHTYSSGAYCHGDFNELKTMVLEKIQRTLKAKSCG